MCDDDGDDDDVFVCAEKFVKEVVGVRSKGENERGNKKENEPCVVFEYTDIQHGHTTKLQFDH